MRLTRRPPSNSQGRSATSNSGTARRVEPTLSISEKDITDFYDMPPTLACICGCRNFYVVVMWDEETRSVGWYDLRQTCKSCGAISKAPTPIDEV